MVQFRFGWRLVDFGLSVKANSIEWYGISDKNGGQALALGPRLRDCLERNEQFIWKKADEYEMLCKML